MKNIAKKIIVTVLCITSILTSIISVIPIAKADSSSLLGTSEALGSPILNNNFTLDDWNKWEIVCWGVFLSNFCQPLIDNYESAFKTTGTGSNGAGYQALCFGSGSDAANNETIEAFCDYAIAQQGATKKDLYVGYSLLEKDGTLTKNDPNSGGTVRNATFNDIFLSYVKSEGDLKDDQSNYTLTSDMSSGIFSIEGYKNIKYMSKVYIPTFYIKNGSKYTTILDYTSSWDLQMASAILNAVRSKEEYSSQFIDAYTNLSTSNPAIYLDPFANIMVEGKMLVPSCANPNITKEKKVNILNSWIMNSYASTYSNEKLTLGLRQNIDTGWFSWWRDSKKWRVGGMPAFGESKIGSAALLYYDLDSIVVKDYYDGSATSKINYGEAVEKLFSQDITKPDQSKYPLKFEVAGNSFTAKELLKSSGDSSGLSGLTLAASILPNYMEEKDQPDLLHEIVKMDGSTESIFSSTPVVIAPQLLALDVDDMSQSSNEGAIREYYNFLYEGYTGQITETTAGSFDKSTVQSILKDSSTIKDFRSNSEKNWKSFQKVKTKYNKTKFPSDFWDYGKNESISEDSSRLTLAYPASDVIRGVSSVLSVQDGTEFNLYSTMIYMTYLDWYGVSESTTIKTGTEKTSDFNEEIYAESDDIMNMDPGAIAKTKSEDELESEVLQMSYLMLHPEEGRKYRKELIFNGITDFLYEEYNRTVYGGKSNNYTGTASKSNSGFLAIETYSENWLTSWFLDNYTDIAVWVIAICCILIIIIGLFKGRKISWYVFSLFVVVNVVLIVPSSGEIVPYITSNFVQSLFTNNMTYWSISEGVANAEIENDSVNTTNNFEGMSSDDAKSMTSLVKQLNTVYLDRSLMMKQDISQKLTQQLGGIYSEIQNLPSARWILPMVMQQFTADSKSTEYLYVRLGNVWDDATNLYWYYKPNDALSITKDTLTSQQFITNSASTASDFEKYNNGTITTYFQDYKLASDWEDDTTTDINYTNYSYTVNSNENDIVHLYAYLLPDGARQVQSRKAYYIENKRDDRTVNMDWHRYIKDAQSKPITSWETDRNALKSLSQQAQIASSGFEVVADTYDRTDAETLKPGYSFYKHTESPFYYFFNVVKDSFDPTKTVGSVIGNLQGEIEKDENDEEVRSNFMYATKTANKEVYGSSVDGYTGYVRDCLDLQNFFNNTVPYLYQITLMTGGFDGKSGILGDTVISDESDHYSGNLQSWAYRCNWAVKLMENKQFLTDSAGMVRDSNGNKYIVMNPLLPDTYPTSRPMIFSEAQMYAYGLKEADLNLVELKCVKVNKEVAKKWTLLINYAGTDGLTKEVLFRQMATDATQIFNTEFSSGGLTNNKYSLYPQSIDLRYLSFDSVMKMLMLNVSKDTSYIYGDTMSKLLNDTDMFTAVLLMLSAWACAYFIPLARTILMALIFYLGFGSIIRSLFSSAKQKAKIACGQFISNIVFMVYTLIYYACFSGLMAISSSDEVLSINRIESNAGNPVWVLLAIILLSGTYLLLMIKQIKFCLINFKDMGIESYSMIAGAMVGKIQDSMSKVGSGLSSFFNRETNETSSSSSSSTSSISGTGIKNESSQNVNVTTASGDTITVKNDSTESELDIQDDLTEGYYSSGDDGSYMDTTSSDDINAEIEAGSKL